MEKEGARLPPTFLYHGVDDSGVPILGSEKFVELSSTLGCAIHFEKVSGEHGFDADIGLRKVDAPGKNWLRDGLEFVTKAWLG